MKIVYFGTPQFAAEVLSYLLENGISVAAVITKPDKAQGRSKELLPTPVKETALKHGIPVHQPEIVSTLEFAPTLSTYNADLFVVVAYGEIIKQHLLDMPKLGCINLHASLLPKYRGAAPIQRCIINGETESGVSIIYMARKMDAGDIIQMSKVSIGPDTSYGELQDLLCRAGAQTLLKVIRDFEKGIVHRIPQQHEEATLAPKLELEDCELDWNRPAQELHNLVRGVFPFPGAWCYVVVKGQKLRLKILKATIERISHKEVSGRFLAYGKDGVVVACGEQALRLIQVQLEGKKVMHAEELARGIQLSCFEH